jgi:ubiquitin carboxyl-terminal hydrolase 4/11
MSTLSSSPPPLDELPNFDESQHDQLVPSTDLNSLLMDSEDQSFHLPSSFKASPTSSNEVEADDEGPAALQELENSHIRLSEGGSSCPRPLTPFRFPMPIYRRMKLRRRMRYTLEFTKCNLPA